MLQLEEIKRDAAVNGNKPAQILRIVTTELVGENALKIYYKTTDGQVKEQRLSRSNEPALSLAKEGRLWVFEAPDEFNLADEVYRVNLAHLFEPMMAVHTSNTDPLPHRIVAAYESKHRGQPLWGILNDDPSSGKTIMAGLLTCKLLNPAVINVARVV